MMSVLMNPMVDVKKALLVAGFAGIALAGTLLMVIVIDGSLFAMRQSGRAILLVLGALFSVALVILIWRSKAPVLPLPVAFVGAISAGLTGFAGLLFLMTDVANGLIFMASMLTAVSVGSFSREAFDQTRRHKR